MIVSVASDSGGGINPRCGSRTKRAIYDLNGPVHLMGWKKDSFGPNDYRGTATLKVTSGSTQTYYILRGYNPHDVYDFAHEIYKVNLGTPITNPDLQFLWNSVKAFQIDGTLNSMVFITANSIMQSDNSCTTCSDFCLTTSLSPSSSSLEVDEGDTTNWNDIFSVRDNSALLLTFHTDPTDYEYYYQRVTGINQVINGGIDQTMLNNNSIANPCGYTLAATFPAPHEHVLSLDDETYAFQGITVASEDICPGTSQAPSSQDYVVIFTDLTENGVSVSSPDDIVEEDANIICAEEISDVGTYTVTYAIGFKDQSDAEILACTQCIGSYTLIVAQFCTPVFNPGSTITITVELFAPMTVATFSRQSANSCSDTNVTYLNSNNSPIFTHGNPSQSSHVDVNIQATSEDQEGVHQMEIVELARNDVNNYLNETLIVTVINTCLGITLVYDPIPQVVYYAGDPEITIPIPNFAIDPSTANCPSIQHFSYVYTVIVGNIDPSWIILNHTELTPNVKFATPTNVAGVLVPYAVVEVQIVQVVEHTNSPGTYYFAEQGFFYIELQPFLDPCSGVQMTTAPYTGVSYTAGDPPIGGDIADFQLNPSIDPSCPAVVHSYTYAMVSGPEIDASWITFDTASKTVFFSSPIYVGDYEPVLAANILITVTQSVTDTLGVPYETATETFIIAMSEGVMPCEELEFNPDTYNDVNLDILADVQYYNQFSDWPYNSANLASYCSPSFVTHSYTYSESCDPIDSSWVVFGYKDITFTPEQTIPSTGAASYPSCVIFTLYQSTTVGYLTITGSSSMLLNLQCATCDICSSLQLISVPISDSSYTAGHAPIFKDVPDFDLAQTPDPSCPLIVHTYSYNMYSGPMIDPGYITLDSPNKQVGFWIQYAYEGDYELIPASTVLVTVTQTITSAAGFTYTTATSAFLIVMTEGEMPCEELEFVTNSYSDVNLDILADLQFYNYFSHWPYNSQNLATACQATAVTHSYSYAMLSGPTISPSWMNFNQQTIQFVPSETDPATGGPSYPATIIFEVTQTTTTTGAYAPSAQETFLLFMDCATCGDSCASLQLSALPMTDEPYVAGNPIIGVTILDFDISPPPDPSCPAITHSYTYTMASGTAIDPTWITFDAIAKYITFATPVYVGVYDPILAANIEVTVTQSVTSVSGTTYTTATGTFLINMDAGVMPCQNLQFETTPFNDVNFDIIYDAPQHRTNVDTFDLIPSSLASACQATIDVTYQRQMILGPEFPEMWIIYNLPGFIDLWPQLNDPYTGALSYPAVIEFTILQSASIPSGPLYLQATESYYFELDCESCSSTSADPCNQLVLTSTTPITQESYVAGDPSFDYSVLDFDLAPTPDPSCPAITHSYSYQVTAGSIDSAWITLDAASKLISFATPVYVGDYDPVLAANIEVTVTQSVTSASGSTYTTAAGIVYIDMTVGAMPCSLLTFEEQNYGDVSVDVLYDEPGVDIYIPLFDVIPSSLASSCGVVISQYISYQMLDGPAIEPSWIQYNTQYIAVYPQEHLPTGEPFYHAIIQFDVLNHAAFSYGQIDEVGSFYYFLNCVECDPCQQLELTATIITDMTYTAGDPLASKSIADFLLDPNPPDPSCPSIVHTYTYSMVSGLQIDPTWLIFDESTKSMTFETPVYIGIYVPVEQAQVVVTVTQTVTSNSGTTYTSADNSFMIFLTEATDPCSELVLTPVVISNAESTTGDPLHTLDIPDFELTPAYLVSQCLGITHSYTYEMESGVIEGIMIVMDDLQHQITFEASETVEGIPVESAIVSVSVQQQVFSLSGNVLTSATSSFNITMTKNPCFDLHFTNQLADYEVDYTAGDSPIIEQIQVQTLSPSESVALCPGITQLYSYVVEEGTIETDWINLDLITEILTFQTPATYEEIPVNSAVVRVNLMQSVISDEGYIYTSVTQTVVITIEESATGFCVPDFMGLAPTQQMVNLHLEDAPTQLLVTSKSMNNCSDTSFIIRNANNTEVDPSVFQFEVFESPHEALMTVLADQLGTFVVEVKEQANSDPSLFAISQYEVVILHPCEDISLSAETFADIEYTSGSGAIEISIPDFVLNPSEVADKCPLITHEYTYSVVCGLVEDGWLELDSAQHKLTFETPPDTPSASITVNIAQYVDEEGGKRYASASASFKMYVGDSQSGCFTAPEITVTEEAYIPPVHMAIHTMSIDGNLTMSFDRPIVVPQIFLDMVVDSRRSLDSEEFSFHDLVELYVISSIHEEGSEATVIEDYHLTRFTETAFDIQVDFKQPAMISQFITQPDRLGLRFKDTRYFEEADSFIEQLDISAGIKIEVDLVPQVSSSDMAEIYGNEEQSKQAMSVVSTTNLILNCFLYVGLKYLWNMVNLLQFEVFMLLWQISIPYKAEAFLKYIKLLALMEFVPSAWLTDTISEWLSIECEEEDETCQDSVDESERTGLNKLGSTNIVSNMGIMFLVAVIILIFVLVLFLSKNCVYRDYRLYKAYMTIRQRIFWNAFIRYALQSELKLLISACSVVMLEASKDLPDIMNMVFPIMMLFFLLLCPLLFLRVMMKYRKELGKPSVKDRIGTLYLGLRPERDYVVSYSMVFILRRIIFVIITFALFNYPGIQIQVFIYTSLLYIIYISHVYFHDPMWSRDLEMVNESIFLLVCYHIVIFVNLLWDLEKREYVGKSLVWTTGAILIMNTSIIVIVSLKDICRKLQLMRMKKNHKKQMVKRMYEIAQEIKVQEKKGRRAESQQLSAFQFTGSNEHLSSPNDLIKSTSNLKLKSKKKVSKRKSRVNRRKTEPTIQRTGIILEDCKVQDVEGVSSSSSGSDSDDSSKFDHLEEEKGVDIPIPTVNAYKESNHSDLPKQNIDARVSELNRQNRKTFSDPSKNILIQLNLAEKRRQTNVNFKPPSILNSSYNADFGTSISKGRARADTGDPNLINVEHTQSIYLNAMQTTPQLTNEENVKLDNIMKSIFDRMKDNQNPDQKKLRQTK